jgi:hypothetical protein
VEWIGEDHMSDEIDDNDSQPGQMQEDGLTI